MEEENEQGKVATNILTNMINNGQAVMDDNGNVEVRSQAAELNDISQSSQQPHHQDMVENSQGFNI